MNIKVVSIKDHPEAIPTLVKLWHEMLGKIWEPETPYKVIESWFYEWLNDNIPLAFVAFDGVTPIGMCSLQLNDGMPSDLKPWLGDLCVATGYQNRGIGKLLIKAAQEKAIKEGFDKLYLIAPDATIPNYYKRLGWEKIGMGEYKGQAATLMRKKLTICDV